MIDRDFIGTVLARFEGRSIPRGYVPCRGGTFHGSGDMGEPLGASGVTVATGVDLGQQSEAGLRAMGISAGTLAVLAPYLGLKRADAVAKLRARPLTLSPEQVAEIDGAVHERYIANAAKLFGREAFAAAPREVQAVAVSLHYQFGVPARPLSPALEWAWNAMKAGRYREAAAALREEELWSVPHRSYMNRRRAEAALLREACSRAATAGAGNRAE